MHTTLAVSSSSGTSSTGALPAPSSSPSAFASGAGVLRVLGLVLLTLAPLLLFFFFLFPFFLLLLLEAAAGPAHYRNASFPISENAHKRGSPARVVMWPVVWPLHQAHCMPLKSPLWDIPWAADWTGSAGAGGEDMVSMQLAVL